MLIKKIQLTYGQGHEVKGQGQTCNYEKNFFSLINHERMIGSWWYLHIWSILMILESWHKVKVTGSKVKVKLEVMWKNCFVYKTRMDNSILMKLIYIVDVDKKNSVDIWSRSRGQRSRSNVQLWENVFRFWNMNGGLDLDDITTYNWYKS